MKGTVLIVADGGVLARDGRVLEHEVADIAIAAQHGEPLLPSPQHV